MKKIVLKDSLKPFSSTPGVTFPYPKTLETVQFYPTAFILMDENQEKKRVTFEFSSLVQEMRVFYHLTYQRFEMQLKFQKGIFHYHLEKIEDQWKLEVKRCSVDAFLIGFKKPLKKGDGHFFSFGASKEPLAKSFEILTFGCHKKSLLEKMYDRKDPKELFPFLFLLGQMKNKPSQRIKVGPFSLLDDVYQEMRKKNHDQLLEPLKRLLKSFFSFSLLPHLQDIYLWGDQKESCKLEDQKRFDLLYHFYDVVRSFFFQRKQEKLFFFPHLPAQLDWGQGVHFQEKEFYFSFEWSKKTLKKIELHAQSERTFIFNFPSPLKHCRVQVDKKSFSVNNGQSLLLEKNKTYFFDRFER